MIGLLLMINSYFLLILKKKAILLGLDSFLHERRRGGIISDGLFDSLSDPRFGLGISKSCCRWRKRQQNGSQLER